MKRPEFTEQEERYPVQARTPARKKNTIIRYVTLLTPILIFVLARRPDSWLRGAISPVFAACHHVSFMRLGGREAGTLCSIPDKFENAFRSGAER